MLEIDWNTSTILAEVFYCIIGLIFAFTGVGANLRIGEAGISVPLTDIVGIML